MKKKLSLLLCLVAAVFSLFALGGCDKNEPDYNGGEMINGEMYKYGYVFRGWSDKNGTIKNDVTEPNGKYFKATWSPKEFAVFLSTEPDAIWEIGSDRCEPVTFGKEYDFSHNLPNGLTCEGLTIKNDGKTYPIKGVWEYDLSEVGEVSDSYKDKDSRYKPYGNVLYGVFRNITAPEYKITYHLNGGEFTGSYTDTFSYTYNEKDPYWMQFTDVYKKGYTLKYWSYDEAGNEKFSRNHTPDRYEDIDLYAVYEKGEYIVDVKNDGTDYTRYTFTYGEDYSLPSYGKNNKGKDFVGYYIRKRDYYGITLGDEIIPAEGKVNFECPSNVSITPYWGYRFVYNLDGGTNSAENPVVLTDNGKATLQPATKENSEFDGWYSDAAFTKPVTKISAENIENGDVYLYAKFSGKKVNVTLDLDGGKCDALETKNVTYHYNTPGTSDKSQTVNLKAGKTLGFYYPSVEKDNVYAFKGWYKDKACTIPYSYDEPVTASFDLYAGFVKLPAFSTSIQSYGTKYTVNPYDYSVVNGNVLAQRTITNSWAGHPTCLCFTAEYDGDYKIYYRGYDTTASARLCIKNVTQNIEYDVTHVYSRYDNTEHSVTVTAQKGDFVVIELERKLTTNKEGDTAKFNFWFEGNFTKPKSTAVATSGCAVILEHGKPVEIPSPVKEGYTFVGWQKADGSMLDTDAEWNITEDTTLKAIYKPNDAA